MLKKIASSGYALALFMFFLPWWTLSCAGKPIMTITGVQTATGFKFNAPDMNSPTGAKEQARPSDPLIIGSAAAILLGLIFGITSKQERSILSGVSGLVAVALLLVFKTIFDGRLTQEGRGLIQVQYEVGFWGALLASGAGAVLHFLYEKAGDTAPLATESVERTPPGT